MSNRQSFLSRLIPFGSSDDKTKAEAVRQNESARKLQVSSKKKKTKSIESMKRNKKKKEKERTRLAEQRALDQLNKEKLENNESPIQLFQDNDQKENKHDAHRDSIISDIKTTKSIFASIISDTITLDDQQRLDILKLNELTKMDQEEAAKRRRKQQEKHNLLLNAQPFNYGLC